MAGFFCFSCQLYPFLSRFAINDSIFVIRMKNHHKIITTVLRFAQLIIAGVLTVMMIKAMKLLYVFLNGEVIR